VADVQKFISADLGNPRMRRNMSITVDWMRIVIPRSWKKSMLGKFVDTEPDDTQ